MPQTLAAGRFDLFGAAMARKHSGSSTTSGQGPLTLVVSRGFPPSPASVREVRRLVADHLSDVEAACRETIVLVASELATNAVCHAGTPYVVDLYMGDVGRVEVTDLALVAPFVRAAPPTQGGRGLLLVSAMSFQWGVDWHDDHKVVWAELPLDGPA